MTQVFPDTPPETEHALFTMLREMPPWRKLEMMAQLNQTVRELALTELSERYPAASPAELHRRLSDIVLGTELAERAYGPLNTMPTIHIDLNEIALKVETETYAKLLEVK